jgi:integrase
VAKALRTAGKRAGLPYEVCFYDVRHLWITTMLDAGASAAAVAEMAGTSLEMIMANYYEINRSEKDRAVGLLPKLSKEQTERMSKIVDIASMSRKNLTA